MSSSNNNGFVPSLNNNNVGDDVTLINKLPHSPTMNGVENLKKADILSNFDSATQKADGGDELNMTKNATNAHNLAQNGYSQMSGGTMIENGQKFDVSKNSTNAMNGYEIETDLKDNMAGVINQGDILRPKCVQNGVHAMKNDLLKSDTNDSISAPLLDNELENDDLEENRVVVMQSGKYLCTLVKSRAPG